MAPAISWPQTQLTNRFQSGVDRVVVYPLDNEEVSGPGQAWPGVQQISKSYAEMKSDPLYFDGVKYDDFVSYGSAEFDVKTLYIPSVVRICGGHTQPYSGFYVTGQRSSEFNLTYRTLIDGGDEYILNFVTAATPSLPSVSSATRDQGPKADGQTVKLKARPLYLDTVLKNSSHYRVHSSRVSPTTMNAIESILYGGTMNANPRFFSYEEMSDLASDGIFDPITEPI